MTTFEDIYLQLDAVEFAKERLTFLPDERQAALLMERVRAVELHAAVGQVHH